MNPASFCVALLALLQTRIFGGVSGNRGRHGTRKPPEQARPLGLRAASLLEPITIFMKWPIQAKVGLSDFKPGYCRVWHLPRLWVRSKVKRSAPEQDVVCEIRHPDLFSWLPRDYKGKSVATFP